jgi:LmbE family N-acetylglucosaminyl deacetylase
MELVADRSYLGAPDPTLGRMGLPDARVAPVFDDLRDLLIATLFLDDLCLAPWGRDGHPDHNAAAKLPIEARSQRAQTCLSTRSGPGPGPDPTRPVAAQKRWITSASASQIRPLALDRADHPWLPAPIFRPSWRLFEVFGLGGSNK